MSLSIIISELFTHIFVPLSVSHYNSVGFLSQLDDVAFHLAKCGRFGPTIEVETSKIEQLPLPSCMYRKKKHVRYFWTVFVTGIFLVSLHVTVFVHQYGTEKWTTNFVRVQFKEETGQQDYDGCYKINEGKDFDMRHTYTSNNDIIGELSSDGGHDYSLIREKATVENNAAFGYCKKDKTWILYNDDMNNNSDACNTNNGIIRSTKTSTFDISSSFDDAWYGMSGTPMSLYFFEDEKDLNCGFYINDGICDASFNHVDRKFDGGDCCAATCNQPSCGMEGLTSVFGNANITGDGYSDCRDPSMVSMTIRLDDILWICLGMTYLMTTTTVPLLLKILFNFTLTRSHQVFSFNSIVMERM